jgi:uncharacterized protein YndB with AHSA1/START domain
MSNAFKTTMIGVGRPHENGKQMREHVHENEVLIDRPIDAVFGYVSQPWRWHEWHPASESAAPGQPQLLAGVQFDELASMQPLALLPIRMRSHLHWTVVQAQAPHLLVMTASSERIELQVRYELAQQSPTRFRRVFRFRVKGWLRFVEHYFLPERMRQQSVLALANLKRVLEAQA